MTTEIGIEQLWQDITPTNWSGGDNEIDSSNEGPKAYFEFRKENPSEVCFQIVKNGRLFAPKYPTDNASFMFVEGQSDTKYAAVDLPEVGHLFLLDGDDVRHIADYEPKWESKRFLGEVEDKAYFLFEASNKMYLYELANQTLTDITPAGAWRDIVLLGKLEDSATFLLKDDSQKYRLYARDSRGLNNISAGKSWDDIYYSSMYEGKMYVSLLGNDGNGVQYEQENGVVRDITPEGSWLGFSFLGGQNNKYYFIAAENMSALFLYERKNGEWQNRYAFQVPGMPTAYFGQSDQDYFIVENEDNNKSIYQLKEGKLTDILDASWDSVSFLGEVHGECFLKFEEEGFRQPYLFRSSYLLKLTENGLINITPDGEWYGIQLHRGETGPALFTFYDSVESSSSRLLWRDSREGWHDISPAKEDESEIRWLGSQGDKALFYVEPDRLLSLDLGRLGDTPADLWQPIPFAINYPWKDIAFLGVVENKQYLRFEDSNRHDYLYEQENGKLKSINPDGTWQGITFVGVLNGNLTFTFEDDSQNEFLYQRRDEHWQNITPDGRWLDISFLGEQGGKLYFQCEVGEESYRLWARVGEEWNDITPEGVWSGVALLGEHDGKATFRLQDSAHHFHLFEQDGTSLNDMTPPGNWIDIEVLDRQEGQATHSFRDASRNLHLFERVSGNWLEIANPPGQWTSLLFLGLHGERQYFRFQYHSRYWVLFARVEGKWHSVSPDGRWEAIAYLGTQGGQAIFGFFDRSGFQLYAQDDANTIEITPPSDTFWQHIALLGSHGDQGYYRVRDQEGKHRLFMHVSSRWREISPQGEWRDIMSLGIQNGMVLFDFRDTSNELHLYEFDGNHLEEITPLGKWRNIRFLGESGDRLHLGLENESGTYHLYKRTTSS